MVWFHFITNDIDLCQLYVQYTNCFMLYSCVPTSMLLSYVQCSTNGPFYYARIAISFHLREYKSILFENCIRTDEQMSEPRRKNDTIIIIIITIITEFMLLNSNVYVWHFQPQNSVVASEVAARTTVCVCVCVHVFLRFHFRTMSVLLM